MALWCAERPRAHKPTRAELRARRDALLAPEAGQGLPSLLEALADDSQPQDSQKGPEAGAADVADGGGQDEAGLPEAAGEAVGEAVGEAAKEPGQNGAQAKLKAQEEPIPGVVEVERAGGTPACIPSNALGEWGSSAFLCALNRRWATGAGRRLRPDQAGCQQTAHCGPMCRGRLNVLPSPSMVGRR